MESTMNEIAPSIEAILQCEKGGKFPKELTEGAFGAAVAPWIVVARAALKKKMPQMPAMISKEAMSALERELIQRWSELCTPVFVLEMHIVKLENGLMGETSKERYEDYVTRYLGSPDYLRGIFEEYSVMQEWVAVALTLWVNKVAEFCSRIEEDFTELVSRFGGGAPLGMLKEVKRGLSDPHNGNRSVYELLFESGVSVFYKPKSLGIDAAFNEFLAELNGMGLKPALKAYRTWDRGCYGWVEKVEHFPCESEEEVEEYFTRSGMLLCLFYLFGGTDLHHENLIASGAYPAIIDVESLFHPQLSNQTAMDDPKAWKQSVLRVGMLPNFMMGEMGLTGIDISALGAGGGDLAPSFAPRWESINTDEMRLAYVQPETKEEKNVVYLNGTMVNVTEHLDCVVAGFEKVYALIQKSRDLLMGTEGWLERFAHYPVRCICRPTRLYFKLLQQLLDPKRLRDKATHKEIMDILPRYLLENGNEHLSPVVVEEMRAMEQRDIPFFQTFPKSTDLYLNGEVIIKNVLEEPTFDAARELIDEMSEKRCSEQVDLIRQSFYALDYTKKGQESKIKQEPPAPLDLTDEVLIEEAVKIGRELLQKGSRDAHGGLRWLGVEFLPAEEQAVLAPLSRNLYGGSLGLSLFFGALWHATKDVVWKEAAHASLLPLIEYLEGDGVERLPGVVGLGGMAGVGSIIYSLNHIAELIDDPKLREQALFVTTLIMDKHIEDDNQYDVIAGSAGLILALLSMYNKTQDASLLALAEKVGAHLEKSAQKEETGVSWSLRGKRSLLGFSHGTGGIAYALEKLSVATKNGEFLDVADQALAYERSHFSKEANNWPDFREEEPNWGAFAWCHGAPGIGLGRSCSPRLDQKTEMQQEIECAIHGTKNSFSQSTHHLCCGDLGRAEILRTIAQRTGNQELSSFARSKVASVVQQARREGHYSLNALLPPGVFSPGFMQGTSGMGYALLCFTEKGRDLPHVLILE